MYEREKNYRDEGPPLEAIRFKYFRSNLLYIYIYTSIQKYLAGDPRGMERVRFNIFLRKIKVRIVRGKDDSRSNGGESLDSMSSSRVSQVVDRKREESLYT